MSEVKKIALEFANEIENLAIANRLTGLWDNRRNIHCKRPTQEINLEYLVKTEKRSRANVEKRAHHRTKIDQIFAKLVEYVKFRQP